MYKKLTFGLHWKISLPILVLIFLLGFTKGYDKNVEEGLFQEFNLLKSQNPEASKAFIMMLKNALYIDKLHTFFDYDSIVMKPFLNNMNEYYHQGKNLLPIDSVEDVYWWTVAYQSIYALGQPQKNDYSMAREKVLSNKNFREFHESIYQKIIRYFNGQIYFKLPIITRTHFHYGNVLVSYYMIMYSSTYEGDNHNQKNFNYLKDEKSSIIINKLLRFHREFSEKYLKFDTHPESKYRYMLTHFRLSLDKAKRAFAKSGVILPAEMCTDYNSKIIVDYINELMKYVKNSSTNTSRVIDKTLFIEGNTPSLLIAYSRSCRNLKNKLEPIIRWIQNKSDE